MVLNMVQFPLAVFINPAFFWAGGALASIPIIIHILNRRRFKVVYWAAMEYLLQAMRKNRRRLKFEQWVLLAVRCLVLFLLGLALARPLGCDQSSLATAVGRQTGLHVFVIDNSLSMGYEANRPDAKTHLDQAKRLVSQLIEKSIGNGEAVVVLTACTGVSEGNESDTKVDDRLVIGKPSYNHDEARAAVQRIAQTERGTDLVWALNKALEVGREWKEPRKNLYLLTDATVAAWQGGKAEALAQVGPELAKTFRVTHFNLGKKEQWNHAVMDFGPTSPLVTTRFPTALHARLAEFGTGTAPLVQWKQDDKPLAGGGTLAKVDGDQVQAVEKVGAGGPHVFSVSLVSDNRLKADDTRWRVVDVAAELKVLIVEGDRGTGALSGSAYYLEPALAAPKAGAGEAGSARTDSYVAPEVISDLELANKVLTNYRAVFLANVAQVTGAQAEQLKKYAEQGGAVIWFMGEQVNADNYNKVLSPLHLMPGKLTKLVRAGEQEHYTFDFRPDVTGHPFLGLFYGRENTGLNTARIFTYWQVELSAEARAERVLNYLPPGSADAKPGAAESRDPAITVHSLGDGRVVLFTTTANHEWTTLPVKPAYVALMHEVLDGSVRSTDQWMNLAVGQALELPPTLATTAAPVLVDPGQREMPLEQTTNAAGQAVYRSRPLEHAGVYTLKTGGPAMPVAVNVSSDEANIRTLDNAAIKKALGNAEANLEGDQLPPDVLSRAGGNDWSWSVMVVVLVLAGVECLLAMRFGHYRRKGVVRGGEEGAEVPAAATAATTGASEVAA